MFSALWRWFWESGGSAATDGPTLRAVRDRRPARRGHWVRGVFAIENATGTAVAPDALPTAALWRDGVLDAAVTVTVTASPTTGLFSYAFVVPKPGYSRDDGLTVTMTTAVAGVPIGPRPVGRFFVEK